MHPSISNFLKTAYLAAIFIPTPGFASQDQVSTPYASNVSGKVIPTCVTLRKATLQTLYLSDADDSHPCNAKPSQFSVSKPIVVSKPSKSTSSDAPVTSDEDPGDDYGKPKTLIPDPIQSVNRGVFWFNHQLYHYIFTPLNKTYKFVFPQPARTGIHNVFLNFEYPARCVNDLLQWKPELAGLETEKFLINTTAGVGGIFKVSDKIPYLSDVPQTDTAATLAKWKIPSGCYIVWPVLGPKSLRDTVGFVGDIALDPVTWVTYGAVGGLAGASSLALSAPETTSKTSDKLDTYETLTRTSIDKYNAVKSAYEQNRKKTESQ
jgi:phospholipid-binding lipoprotein MlaA